MAETTNAATTTQATETATNTAVEKTAAEQVSSQTETSPVREQKTQNTDFEDLIQRAVDRATNKLGNENKKLRGEIDALKKANMSESELRQLEIKEKEKEIAEREQKLLEKENRLLAIKAIKEVGLDDGSDASLALVDFVMAEDEAAIKERVKAFDGLVKRFVKSEVDKVFKASGRTPGKGSANDTETKADSVAVRIGQNTAKANKTAQSTLDYYIGGKK